MTRQEMTKRFLEDNQADAILFHNGEFANYNRFWFFGVETTAGYGLVSKDRAWFTIDSRYIEHCQKEIKHAEVSLFQKITDLDAIIRASDAKVIALEAEYCYLALSEMLKARYPDITFKPVVSKNLRITKTSDDVSKIKSAIEKTEESLDFILKTIKPGMTEEEVSRTLEIDLIKRTGGGFEFIIVASGSRGSLPHGRPTDKVIEEGDMVTLDFGTRMNGWCSDITRSFVVGDKATDPKMVEIYNIVKEAQQRGVNACKPGVSSAEVDAACRDYITEQGYGQYFTHSTGHGLGTEVHETPGVAASLKDTILKPGNVITVEPGIYINGIGGVRIEDDVLITENGHECLTTYTKELLYINNK